MNVRKLSMFLLSAMVLLWDVSYVSAQPETAHEKRQKAQQRLREATIKYNRQTPTQAPLAPLPGPYVGFNPLVDYTKPNFAYSPNLRKFVDSLPGLGAPGCTPVAGGCNENNLGQYIPIAAPATLADGSDYYQIGLTQYTQRLHSDLPAAGTKLRGYYQKGSVPQYLGPLIIAKRNRPVRLRFFNELPLSNDSGNNFGNLPLPVDTTIMGAGMGPLTAAGGACDPTLSVCATYPQNRATIHLHGGLTPWISDGTPHQWITPALDPTPYKKGVSFQNVPGMGAGATPDDGTATYYYPNQQSARLMFYHDHSYGITRLNVYDGEAAGYLLTDSTEEDLINRAILPSPGPSVYRYGIPLIIQDRTFVNDDSTPPGTGFPGTATQSPKTSAVDPLWNTYVSGSVGGDFWFPHEYMPNENIYDTTGSNPLGRWDYGPWMIPPMLALNDTLPSPTLIPEAYGDTPMVNGTAFPYVTLPPTAVRFRILNATNDRMLNLQLYYAKDKNGAICKETVPAPMPPAVTFDAASCTEVSMVPASPNPAYPTWPRDGRDGGVPNPTTAGPDIIQVGNEAGFLTKPAIFKQQPIDYDYNRRSVTFGGVTSKTLLLPSAVRADVIVDFAQTTPGSILILYNDAPAPMPLFDARNDMFTDDPDQTASGGAPSTPAGFGPNTRTIMQIRIDPAGVPTAPYDVAALQGELPTAFANSQDPLLVPPNVYANAVDESMNLTGTAQPVARVVTTLPGLGYKTVPTVKFAGGGCTTLPTATASLNGITGVALVTAGAGYTTAPLVSFTGGGGKGATAVATISGGVVTTITVTNPGSGYTKVPNVSISGGGGAGATAVATITLGSVGAITLVNPGSCLSAPQVFLQGGSGTGAAASAMLRNAVVLNGKNLVEGFDMQFGRMSAVLGSTPNPLAPTVGAGPVVGPAFYVDPPTEILNGGETVLWRISHIGVDSHAIHFHLFNVQVVNRVDWTNTIKPPYEDEYGWKETIRTNPFEDIIVAIKPKAAVMQLPWAIPNSNRLLDPTMPLGSTANFTPAAPPPGLPGVAGTTNVMTNFGWEYVWHCHLLGHEENDMMRPIVFLPDIPVAVVAPAALAFGTQVVNKTTTAQTVSLSNTGRVPLTYGPIAIAGTNASDFSLPSTTCVTGSLAAGATCTINVTFKPTAIGARSATLTITGNSNGVAGSTQSVALTGTGK